MTQDMKEDRLDRNQDSEQKNSYEFMIINIFQKINVKVNTSQMDPWSIFSKSIFIN